jgi:hypothetical protein
MASLSSNQGLYSAPLPIEEEQAKPISKLDEDILSWKKKGNLNLGNPKHIPMIEQYAQAAQMGLLSEKAVHKLAEFNPGAAVAFISSYNKYKQESGLRKELGQYSDPGKPETPDRPFTDADQGAGVGPYRIGQPIIGTGTPEIAPKVDYDRAIAHATRAGNMDLAQKYQALKSGDRSPSMGELTMTKAIAAKHGFKSTADLAEAQNTPEGKKRLALLADELRPQVKVTDEEGVSSYLERSAAKNRRDYGQLHKDVLRTSTDLSEKNVIGLGSAIDLLSQKIEKDPEFVKDNIGYAKNMTLHRLFAGPEGQKVKSLIASVKSEIIRKNAGLTQTAQELERTLEMMAADPYSSAEAFLAQFDNLKNTYASELKYRVNSLGEEGKKMYLQRQKQPDDLTPWERRASQNKQNPDDEYARLKAKHLKK